jgi:hypothetical protein
VIINIPTLAERIIGMTDLELENLATGEALAMADSSRLEGLVLDQEKIRSGLLAGYFSIREGCELTNSDPDIRKQTD